MCGWPDLTSTASMPLASEPLRLPLLARCPALGVSLGDGCLLPRPPRCGQVRSAVCARTGSAHRGRHRTRNRVRRRAAGIARTRSAAAAMLKCSMLRTASVRCAARGSARPHAPLRSGGHPGSLPRVPAPPAPPFGRPPATASEPYVSACARVRWTRVARGCALGARLRPWPPSPLPCGVFPSSPRPSV